MRKILPFIIPFLASTAVAQVSIDTVLLSAGYSNQCWYSLENDEQSNVSKSDWDIAFETTPMGYSILVNSAIGTQLFKYPGDTTAWATLDTAGMSGWTQLHNADTSWSYGAFAQNQNNFDVGWGTYDVITHIIKGDELYVIKLSNGDYMKIWIRNLLGGSYNFSYASLDNVTEIDAALAKSSFSGKLFGYYSLQNQTAVDKEPVLADWDLMFGQYETADLGYYLVSGVLTSPMAAVTKAYPVADPSNYVDYNAFPASNYINTIGYDWKTFNMTTFEYDIQDSLVYFVETAAGDLWKLIFTGFGGSSNGAFIFSKEKIGSVGINENNDVLINIYPNPANGILNLTYHSDKIVQFELYNLSGTRVMDRSLQPGLNTESIDISHLPGAAYFIRLSSGNSSKTYKVIKI